jgi:hypothetical protein
LTSLRSNAQPKHLRDLAGTLGSIETFNQEEEKRRCSIFFQDEWWERK